MCSLYPAVCVLYIGMYPYIKYQPAGWCNHHMNELKKYPTLCLAGQQLKPPKVHQNFYNHAVDLFLTNRANALLHSSRWLNLDYNPVFV